MSMVSPHRLADRTSLGGGIKESVYKYLDILDIRYTFRIFRLYIILWRPTVATSIKVAFVFAVRGEIRESNY